MLIDDQSAVIAALSAPEAYGFKPSHKIFVKETNISQVFLTGEKAYKLKRGVKYPYVDYSSPEKRLAAEFRFSKLCRRSRIRVISPLRTGVFLRKRRSSRSRPAANRRRSAFWKPDFPPLLREPVSTALPRIPDRSRPPQEHLLRHPSFRSRRPFRQASP